MLNKKSILISGGTEAFGQSFCQMIVSQYPSFKRLVNIYNIYIEKVTAY
jgi:FlaA1/EpsC-like NDP-sugar epimerase